MEFIPFNTLDYAYLHAQLEEQLSATNNLIQRLESLTSSSWHSTIAPLQQQLYKLNQIWGLINHLHSVKDSPELRQLHDKFLPIITDLYVNLGQNKALYQHVQNISTQPDAQLNAEQQKVLANELREFKLNGIMLSAPQQLQFKQLQNQLSALSAKFEHNLLDATASYSRWLTLDDLSGVPQDSLALYQAQAEGKEGYYKVSLQLPSYLPLMQYASKRELRQELYQAYVTRASELSDAGKYDNSPLIQQIVQLRQQKAALLDFANYTELSLYNKMADSSQQVLDFLYQLAAKSRQIAQQDLHELEHYAQQLDGITKLEAWDIPYYSEKLQQHKYSYSSNELKQYFPLPRVFSGLFALIKRLYQLEFHLDTTIPTWHEQVSAYAVKSKGQTCGYLYFDVYAREGKQSGAWMTSAQDRYVANDQATRLPIAYIICNFTPPLPEPSLLTFDEVQTLFHEMGHALHHLLTTIDNYTIAGINGVEWDAVELPSQFMEYFTWDYNLLTTISAHISTGEVIPRELYAKVLAARYYQSGLQMLRQLEFAIFDLLLHGEFNPEQDDYHTLLAQVRQQIAVIQVPQYNRFANSFAHIFAGGYAAGYYSYKWAEVLACDIFSVFDGQTEPEQARLGQLLYQTILSQGGLRPMMANFKSFMGREPQISALLKYSGLATV